MQSTLSAHAKEGRATELKRLRIILQGIETSQDVPAFKAFSEAARLDIEAMKISVSQLELIEALEEELGKTLEALDVVRKRLAEEHATDRSAMCLSVPEDECPICEALMVAHIVLDQHKGEQR